MKENYLFDNRYLIKLLWPLFIEQLLVFAVGITDSIMVAKAGEEAVSAVSLVDSVMILIITIMTAMATGGAVIAGRYLGQKRYDMAVKSADQLLIFIVSLSVIVSGFMYAFRRWILPIMFGDIDQVMMDYCNTYYLIMVASIPFLGVYNAGSAMFRSTGNSKISMKICFVMNVINIPGNYVLLHVFHMGIEGVAIPTLAARVVAAVIIVIALRNQKLTVHISRPFNFKPDFTIIRQITGIGIPNGVENSMFQIGKLILLSFISSMGTAAITANAVANVIASITLIPGFAIGLALGSVVSQCVGAGDYQQVRYYTKKLLKWAYVLMGTAYVISIIAIPAITHIYGLSEQTAHLTEQLLIICAVFGILIWPLSFSLPNMLRASGDVIYTMIVGISSMCVFRIAMAIWLGGYLEMGVVGVWLAMVADWIVRSIAFVVRYRKGKWTEKA